MLADHNVLLVLNPSMKFEWMTAHWSAHEVTQAREWMLEAVRSIDICTT